MTMQNNLLREADDPSELPLFSTIRIVGVLPDGRKSVGTGFFYVFAEAPNGDHVPAIVTNRHVVAGAEALEFHFRKSKADFSRPLIGQHIPVRLTEFPTIPHPDPSVDLCAIPIAFLIHQLNKRGEYPYLSQLGRESLLKTFSPQMPPVRALENILMVGYPIGIWDDVNDMPIARRGMTATHPLLNWRGRKEFLIDAACFPGSSGSPVFLMREGVRVHQPTQQSVQFLQCVLAGILYAGPQFVAQGEIRVLELPTSAVPVAETPIPLNLGVVIKSEVLEDIDAMFQEQMARGQFLHVAKNHAPEHEDSYFKSFIRQDQR